MPPLVRDDTNYTIAEILYGENIKLSRMLDLKIKHILSSICINSLHWCMKLIRHKGTQQNGIAKMSSHIFLKDIIFLGFYRIRKKLENLYECSYFVIHRIPKYFNPRLNNKHLNVKVYKMKAAYI